MEFNHHSILVRFFACLFLCASASSFMPNTITKSVEYFKDSRYVTYQNAAVKVICDYNEEEERYCYGTFADGSYFPSLLINYALSGEYRENQVFDLLERAYEGRSTATDLRDSIWTEGWKNETNNGM